jgi:hypothetical protein
MNEDMTARAAAAPPERLPWVRSAVAVGLVGLLVGVAAVLLVVRTAPPGCCSGSYVTLFDRPVTGVEAVLGRGDGQAFAALAQDPTLARPQVILGHHEAAYRAQRPLAAYLAWAGSLGSADRVPWALAVLEMLGCGLAAGAVAGLLRRRGANPWFALAVIPAGMAAVDGLTPELLALGFGAAGVAAWEKRRPGWAALWLVAAGLTRETMLIVPAVLAVEAVVRTWRGPMRGSERDELQGLAREVAPLAAPFVAFGAWALVIRLRLGAWPADGSHGRIGRPFAGLLDAARTWSSPAEFVWLGLAVVLIAVALLRARRDHLTWIAASYAGFALILGPDVWAQWKDFTRTLLPLYAFAAVAIIGAMAHRAHAASEPLRDLARELESLSPSSSSSSAGSSAQPPRSPVRAARRG